MSDGKSERLVVHVHAGPRSREHCPVTVPLPWSADSLVQLQRQKAARPTPCQLWSDGARTYATWMVDRMRAGATITYILTLGGRQRRAKSRVRIDRLGPHRLHVLTRQRQLAVLRLERGWFCPFWSPVRAPTGHTVTATPAPGELVDAEPGALPKGLWTAAPVSDADSLGHAEMLGPVAWRGGPVFAEAELRQQWQASSTVQLVTRYRSYVTSGRWWLLDVAVTVTAHQGPATLYCHPRVGLLNLDLAPPLWPANRAVLRTGLGAVSAAELNGYATGWVDLSGLSGGRWIGVSVFLPAGAYAGERWAITDQGRLAVGAIGPPGTVWRKLAVGERLTFRARVCVHTGDAGRWGAADRYGDYAFPPRIEVAPFGAPEQA